MARDVRILLDPVHGPLTLNLDTGRLRTLSKCCSATALISPSTNIAFCTLCMDNLPMGAAHMFHYLNRSEWEVYARHIARHDSRQSPQAAQSLADACAAECVRLMTRDVTARPTPTPIVFGDVAARYPRTEDAAAQTVGMLFADQDSTGMLF